MSDETPTPAKPHLPYGDLTFNTAPNWLTIVRIAFVPFVVGAMLMRTSAWDVCAAILFGIASITDYFDGYIARTRKLITIYGKLLDPLADKFLVVCVLIALQELDRINLIVVMLLVCRELAITGLRALASAEGLVIAASGGGKWKTTTQMAAIPMLMLRDSLWGFGGYLFPLGQVLLYISLGMSLWSAKDYVVGFFFALEASRRRRGMERRLARQARREAKLERRIAHAKARGEKLPEMD